mmetsp:Transcript_38229/g.122949  ORF Transcript_38229/g.122949 Transcript_38229/m.122949 type:complete len:241 (+) Transcript_38229:462-1184(+)
MLAVAPRGASAPLAAKLLRARWVRASATAAGGHLQLQRGVRGCHLHEVVRARGVRRHTSTRSGARVRMHLQRVLHTVGCGRRQRLLEDVPTCRLWLSLRQGLAVVATGVLARALGCVGARKKGPPRWAHCAFLPCEVHRPHPRVLEDLASNSAEPDLDPSSSFVFVSSSPPSSPHEDGTRGGRQSPTMPSSPCAGWRTPTSDDEGAQHEFFATAEHEQEQRQQHFHLKQQQQQQQEQQQQ